MTKLPNSRKAYIAHDRRVARYLAMLNRVYETYNKEAAKLASRTSYSGEKPFTFADYPETSYSIRKIRTEFVRNVKSVILSGISAEWDNANQFADKLTNTVLKKRGANANHKQYSKYFSNTDTALKAFVERKERGLSLSSRIWNQSKDYVQGLEAAFSNGLENGMSAVTLSKRISKYLNDYDLLKADYAKKYGKAIHINDCEYRSARLARNEINMAYRTAENERWQQLDFVVGFEVKRSGRTYDCPVCDSLKGKYPKTFKFAGWHPNCRCYQIPILNTEEEFWDDAAESANEVKDVPENFKKWVGDNTDRIEKANNRGTLPYWLKDNQKIAGITVNHNNFINRTVRIVEAKKGIQ